MQRFSVSSNTTAFNIPQYGQLALTVYFIVFLLSVINAIKSGHYKISRCRRKHASQHRPRSAKMQPCVEHDAPCNPYRNKYANLGDVIEHNQNLSGCPVTLRWCPALYLPSARLL